MTNQTDRPLFVKPRSAVVAYTGPGATSELIHPVMSTGLTAMMTALIQEGQRIDDESMKQAVKGRGHTRAERKRMKRQMKLERKLLQRGQRDQMLSAKEQQKMDKKNGAAGPEPVEEIMEIVRKVKRERRQRHETNRRS